MTAPALTQYIQGLTSVSADGLNTFIQSCDTLAELRGFIGATGMQVFVRGQSAPADGYQGSFYWSPTLIGATDNNVSVIIPNGVSVGGWLLIPVVSSGSLPYTPKDMSGVGLSFTGASGQYTNVGGNVVYSGQVTYPSNSSSVQAGISLPVPTGSNPSSPTVIFRKGSSYFGGFVWASNIGQSLVFLGTTGTILQNTDFSGSTVYFVVGYSTAL